MGLFDFLQNPQVSDNLDFRVRYLEERERADALNEDVSYLAGEVRDLQEDLLKIADSFDNVGWSPLPGDEAKEMPLKTVKKVAEIARAMNAMNPFVKRGVKARISYIWGRGVKFDGIESIKDEFAKNRSKMFSPQAYEELEAVLATDGNAFTALPTKDKVGGRPTKAFRISLDEITGCIANPLDKEDIWYYKREYTEITVDRDTGEEKEVSVIKWYPSLKYYQELKSLGKNLPRRWNRYGVEQNYVIQHMTVNKQVGWRWGVPDIMPVIFWAKAYKEYLEDNAMLVKAYSKLAWQIKVPNAAAGNAASAQVMRTPQRDPLTGELKDIGGTFVGTHEMSPVSNNASSVDFSKGSALASAIAAGLEVSKVVITSDPGDGNRATAETLDLPTLKAMESRQQLHVERFMEIFEFWGAKVDLNMSSQLVTIEEQAIMSREIIESAGEKPKPSEYASVLFPDIKAESTKDVITAIGSAVELGIVFPSEARRKVLEDTGMSPVAPWWELPTIEDNPAKKEQQDMEAQQQERQFQLDQQSVIAKQGVSGGVAARGGAQSTNNQARDNRKADSNNK